MGNYATGKIYTAQVTFYLLVIAINEIIQLEREIEKQ